MSLATLPAAPSMSNLEAIQAMEIGVWLGLKKTMTLRYVLRRWTS
jgi:hypothetical protein